MTQISGDVEKIRNCFSRLLEEITDNEEMPLKQEPSIGK